MAPGEPRSVNALLICVPTELVCELAAEPLRRHTPIVAAALPHGVARQLPRRSGRMTGELRHASRQGLIHINAGRGAWSSS